MIKQLILLIQLLGLFFYQLIFTEDLTVTQRVPDNITPGSEATIEIVIKKSDINGFAKVQQAFPNGFTVEPIETKGATFSFKDNKVKFIWMSLPAESEFTISYKIKPNETTEGDFTIGGKFSFISNSEKESVEIPPATFTVGEELIVENPENNNSDQTTSDQVDTTNMASETDSGNDGTGNSLLPDGQSVSCKREIINEGNGKLKVMIEITKNNIGGFAKLTDMIPAGFVASEIESQGGNFSFREQMMKILWLAVPESDKFVVAYYLEPTSADNSKQYKITGDFAYLKNDITSKYTIDESFFNLGDDLMASDTPGGDTPGGDTSGGDTSGDDTSGGDTSGGDTSGGDTSGGDTSGGDTSGGDTPGGDTSGGDTSGGDTSGDDTSGGDTSGGDTSGGDTSGGDTPKTTTVPDPETGVSYKVQICAAHKLVKSDYFARKFSVRDKVNTENHQGWIKYLVGSFDVYKSARDKRNVVRGKIKTAFVTAYNRGERITVQEALMISNQKWYK